MVSVRVNKKTYNVDVEPETPLLWVIRDTIGLTGTKFGCGTALCGACTVHVNGKTCPVLCDANSPKWWDRRLPRSRGYHRMLSIRYRSLGAKQMCQSAATANPGRSWRRLLSWRRIRTPPLPI